MSSALNYFLAGKYFARIFSLSEQKTVVKDSLQLFRLPENLYDSYSQKNLKSFPEEQLTKISRVEDDLISSNLKLAANLFNRNIEYLDFDYQRVIKFTNEAVQRHKFNFEKVFQNRTLKAKLAKHKITENLFFDSFNYFPVIDNDWQITEVKELLLRSLLPKLSLSEDIIILSGEMIWSGWLTLNTILNLISPHKKQKLIIIDVWGILQQFFSNKEFAKVLTISESTQKFIEDVSISILVVNKKDNITENILKTNNKTAITNLFINKDHEKAYSEGMSHTPDYLFIPGGTRKAQAQIPLGMEINRVENLPLSILGKSQLQLEFSADVLIQKSEGSEVDWQEDIGQIPILEEKFIKLKLPRQVTLTVQNGQQVNKDEIIGTRSVLRKLMREKVVSPVKGRINTNYIDLGLLRFDKKIDSEVFHAPFEGKLLGIDKTKYATGLFIDAYTYTIFSTYQRGENVSGRLVTLKELKQVSGPKILLVKEKLLSEVTELLIVKNYVIGVIIVSSDYRKLRGFTKKLTKHKIPLTTVLLSPFSIKEFEEQNEILFLYTGNTVVLADKKVHLLLEKNQLKQIYLRLKSKSEKSQGTGLSKGEEVMIFNYFLQNRYARIEKLSNGKLSLVAHKNLYNTDLNNISKFTVTELNAE